MNTILPTVVEITTETGKDKLFLSSLLDPSSGLQPTIQYVYDLESLSNPEVQEGQIVVKGPMGAIATGRFTLLHPGDCLDGKEWLISAPLETFSPHYPTTAFLLGMNSEGVLFAGIGQAAVSLIQRQLFSRLVETQCGKEKEKEAGKIQKSLCSSCT